MGRVFLIVATTIILYSCGPSKPEIQGDLKKWHKVSLLFKGPKTSELAEINPFTDYRLNVTFSKGNQAFLVPGYFAADGNSEYTSATEGNIWKVHFCPPDTGIWNYSVSFLKGENIAIFPDTIQAPSAKYMDGAVGSFNILPSDKKGRDLRAKGKLQYVGEHYPRFAETGEYMLKVGSDAPENFLAYYEFDATPNVGNRLKKWEAHSTDFDEDATPYLWGEAKDKGKNILGAVNYLSSKGMNAFSFLTSNHDGDDRNVFPYLLKTDMANYESAATATPKGDAEKMLWFKEGHFEHLRFDVSKMAQWEKVFEYADSKGMFLHFKTAENENIKSWDKGETNLERKLYYRELIARYGHHLAMNWNLCEETVLSAQQHRDAINYLAETDPYRNLIVLHTFPNEYEKRYVPLLGDSSQLTGLSVQTSKRHFRFVYPAVRRWVEASDSVGKKWCVACDEPGDAQHALLPDAENPEHNNARVNGLWGTFMAGGWGSEWYFGYKHPHSDLSCEDFRTRDLFWEQGKIALTFFDRYQLPVYNMKIQNELTDSENWVFAGKGTLGEMNIVILVKNGAPFKLNFSEGAYKEMLWYNPRNGETQTVPFVRTVKAPSNQDWVLYIQEQKEAQAETIELLALKDFGETHVSGYVPAMHDFEHNALCVFDRKYPDKFAAALATFKGVSGKYDLTLNTLIEADGQSTYTIFVNQQKVASYTNPESASDFMPNKATFQNINLEQGDLIKVEFNSTTNQKYKLEDGIFDYSRGRWTSLELSPVQ